MSLYRFLAAAAVLSALEPLCTADPAEQPESGQLLPPAIAGYELRTLDVRKPVLFKVDGSWVQVSVPVFFYFPSPLPPQALPLLRRVYDDLIDLGRKPEWTASELQGLIARLDAAIRLLEQPPPGPLPKPVS